MPGSIGALKDMRDVVEQMARLELEIIGAYEAALKCASTAPMRETMLAFREDHVRRWKDLATELRRCGVAPPLRSDANGQLPNHAAALTRCVSEGAMLSLLRVNEHALHALYERWGRSGVVSVRLRYLFRGCFDDVRRHRTWLQKRLVRERYQETG
jgi:hypothetical protein